MRTVGEGIPTEVVRFVPAGGNWRVGRARVTHPAGNGREWVEAGREYAKLWETMGPLLPVLLQGIPGKVHLHGPIGWATENR